MSKPMTRWRKVASDRRDTHRARSASRRLVSAATLRTTLCWPVNDPADWSDATRALEDAALAYAKACGWSSPSVP